jgi:hypothetical protein
MRSSESRPNTKPKESPVITRAKPRFKKTITKPKMPKTIKVLGYTAPHRPVRKHTLPRTSKIPAGVAPEIAAAKTGAACVDSRLSFHPLAEIFPVLDDDRLQALANDITEHGLLDPIVLHERKILDGRSRYLACIRIGVAPKFQRYVGDDPLGFAIGRNVHRRHLTKTQRVLTAARAATLPVGSNQNTPGLPIGRAAKIFDVSERNIARAKAILLRGTAQLVEAVETGKVAVSRAADLRDLAEEVQVAKLREIIERKRKPRNNTKKPGSTGSESTAPGRSGEVRPSQPTPSTECDFVIPKAVDRRVPGDDEVSCSDLLAAWFQAPKLVRLRFIEEVIREF